MANQGEGDSPPPMEIVDDTPPLEEQIHSLQEQLLVSQQHISRQDIIIQDVDQFRAQIQSSFSNIIASTTEAVRASVNPASNENLASPAGRNSRMKICPPDPFTGDKEKCNDFVHSLTMNFSADVRRFNEDSHFNNNRIVYALSYMKTGTAGKWAQLYGKKLADPELPPPTWAEFEIDLRAKFADSNPKATAQNKVKTLRMDGICDDYVLAFETYEEDTEYNDEALLGHFKAGLPYTLRKQVATNGNPATLTLWKRKALAFDREWRAFEVDEKLLNAKAHISMKGNTSASTYGTQSNNNSGRYTGNRNTGSTSAASGSNNQTPARCDDTGTTFGGAGEPMDIDAHRKEGRCFHCHEKGHISRACPKKQGFSIRHLVGSITLEEANDLVQQVQAANTTSNTSSQQATSNDKGKGKSKIEEADEDF